MKPFFLKQQDHVSGGEHHGTGGEWRVEHPRMRWQILEAFAEAADQAGIPHTADFNTGDNTGVGYFQVNQKEGVRWSSARGFLKPVLKSRPNLKLVTGAFVENVVMHNNRAIGVSWFRELKHDVEHHVSRAPNIILAAGAVQSPKILEMSGIGQGERLKSLGLPVVHDLPGVGENLQDHLQLRPIYEVRGVPTMNEQYANWLRRPFMAFDYAFRRRGPMTMARSQMDAFAKSNERHATSNVQFHVQPLSLPKFGEPMHDSPAITVSVCNLRPDSRGSIHAKSPDPKPRRRSSPTISPRNLTASPPSNRSASSGRSSASPRSKRPIRKNFCPASACSPTMADQGRRRYRHDDLHPVGTAKMGLASDPHVRRR